MAGAAPHNSSERTSIQQPATSTGNIRRQNSSQHQRSFVIVPAVLCIPLNVCFCTLRNEFLLWPPLHRCTDKDTKSQQACFGSPDPPSPWLSGWTGVPRVHGEVQLSSRKGLWDLRQVPCLGLLCPRCCKVCQSKEIALYRDHQWTRGWQFSSLWMIQCIKTPRRGDCSLWQTWAGGTTEGTCWPLRWFCRRKQAEPSEEVPDERCPAAQCSGWLRLSLAGSPQLEIEIQIKTQPVLRGLHPSTVLLWRAVVWSLHGFYTMTRTINERIRKSD